MEVLGDPADLEIFEKAVLVHTKCQEPVSLKLSCFEYFSKNTQIWCQACEKLNDWDIFNKLPYGVRNDMLLHFLQTLKQVQDESPVNHIHKFVQMLLNKETKVLDLYNWNHNFLWTELDSSQVIQLLETILLKAPNLEHLSLFCCLLEEPEVLESTLKMVLQLRHLRHLSLRGMWWLADQDLIEIPVKMPNLITLKLQLKRSVTTAGLVNFPSLTQLKEFHFWLQEEEGARLSYEELEETVSINEEVYTWCAINVPSLRLLGAETVINPDMNFELLDITPAITGSSQLEYLHTCKRLPVASMPNLKHLYFRGPIAEPEDFFQKLSEYTLLCDLTLDWPDFSLILESVGQRLSRFCFGSGGDFLVDYFKILFLCPNLKQLIQCTGSQSVSDSMCRSLVKKQLALEEFSANFNRLMAPKGLIRLIFESAQIETIHLRSLIIRREECLLVHEIFDNNFPNLKYLVFDDMELASDCTMDEFVKMIKIFICSAPNLKFVSVRWKWDTDYFSQWRKYEDLDKFLELINSKMI